LNPLTEKILEEIGNQGPISFKRFMERALYCPVYGYYEKEGDTIGRRGDYYTSASVGPLFGELLAFQFTEWLTHEVAFEANNPQSSLCLVEAGADRGQLARDILTWVQAQRPALFRKLEYWVIEPSERRRTRQRTALEQFQGKVYWANTPAEVGGTDGGGPPSQGVRGILFSNELLDAMPVHKLQWNANSQTWFEWGVAVEHEHFVWVPLVEDRSWLANDRLPPGFMEELVSLELTKVLPDGYVVEVSTSAAAWWSEAAAILKAGKLVALDYGYSSDDWIIPERAKGTLRAYQGHHVTDRVLESPGEQDITAHVNFSMIAETGEQAGLTTEALSSQERFLTAIAARMLKEQPNRVLLDSERVRQFQTLTHPNQLGHSFRVLVQSRAS
jgi:SAM-dependent MidA family methyltransferase